MTASTVHQQAERGARLLRSVLRIDAASCALTGAASIGMAGQLGPLLGAGTPGVYIALGVALLTYAGWLVTVAAPAEISRRSVKINLALTLVWIVDSVALLASGWQPLTTAGFWVIAALADVAALYGILQLVALRRLR